MKKLFFFSLFGLIFLLAQCSQKQQKSIAALLSPAQLLGKKIFFDNTLSSPSGQACASCHSPESAFADPRKTCVSQGATPELFGTRNTPCASYAAYSPFFHFDAEEGTYIGGLFLDGRAATLSEQAAGPFLNHLEMNNGSKKELVEKIKRSNYKDLFLAVYGPTALDNIDKAFEHINEALEEYEETTELSPFSSKYDAYLKGEVDLTENEERGLQLFNDSSKGNCAACHPSTPDQLSGQVLFTDFTYDNIGVPFNPEIKKLNQDYTTDLGLGAFIHKAPENGKFKVPTLRNVELTAPYFHNGIYTSLEEVVRFYNARDSGKFGPPEVAENVNKDELGNLKLSEEEISDLVAFLKTLNDGYKP